MKALVAREYGSADLFRIEEVPIPEPGSGQLQVRSASSPWRRRPFDDTR